MTTMAKACIGFCILTTLLCLSGAAVIMSDVEKQLEKFGTRVGKNEFVNIYKEPVGSGSDKPGKTFVLLSKLYLVPSSRNEELSSVLKLPSDQLKFRNSFPAMLSSSTTTTTVKPATRRRTTTESTTTPTPERQEERILFREETTTRKAAVYNTNFEDKRAYSTQGAFRGWKLPNTPEVDNNGKTEESAASLRRFAHPGLHRLAEENVTNNNAAADNSKSNNREDSKVPNNEMRTSSSQEDLSWYTLITVPGKSRKSSEGCLSGQRRDHRGICRTVFTPPTLSQTDR